MQAFADASTKPGFIGTKEQKRPAQRLLASQRQLVAQQFQCVHKKACDYISESAKCELEVGALRISVSAELGKLAK